MNLFEYLAELRDRVWSTPTQNHSDLPLFELLKDISEEQFPNIGDGVNVELDWQDSEEVEGAKALRFTIPQGFVILEYWNDAVHGVCYQTPLRSKAASKRRNRALFDAYSDGQVWNKSFDNGYGVFYTRSDGQRHGVWSYHVDFVGVWTAEWQIAKDGNAS